MKNKILVFLKLAILVLIVLSASYISSILIFTNEPSPDNMLKIRIKFASWSIFLILVFILTRQKKIKTQLRNGLYLIAVVIFGILLGHDPSPMGTVKDNIVMLGIEKSFFPPRLMGFAIMSIVFVLIANKFICSWGCQIGTLQDLIFRLNRDKKNKPIFKQIKLPFIITNTIRVTFLISFIIAAFIFSHDLIKPISPFNIYKPTLIGIIGAVFIGIILVSSLFIYRPWCTMFCPFGLTGWLFEKISFFKIKVDYSKCIDCKLCVKACPSTAMEKILSQDGTIPDCFSCSSCIEACPTDALSFSAKKKQERL